MEQKETFENKVLQGVTLKNLLWLAGVLVTIMLGGMGYISTIKKDIQSIATDVNALKTEKVGESKYEELQYKVLEQKVNDVLLRQKDLEIKYNTMLENQINK